LISLSFLQPSNIINIYFATRRHFDVEECNCHCWIIFNWSLLITRFISFILYFLSVFNGFINVLINFILFWIRVKFCWTISNMTRWHFTMSHFIHNLYWKSDVKMAPVEQQLLTILEQQLLTILEQQLLTILEHLCSCCSIFSFLYNVL